jgi:hypothetical protein
MIGKWGRGTYETSDRGALGGRNPKVGRSSVENDLELLRGSSDSNRSVVLSVHVVYDQFQFAS